MTRTKIPILAAMALAALLPVPSRAADQSQICVDVRVGEDRTGYLNCLNAELAREALLQQQAPLPTAPLTAQSAPNQLGVATDAAAREKMGASFGNSPMPQRPRSNFVNPTIPGSH